MDATHRKLAAQCFNAVWELLEKEDRTSDETDTMIDLAHASRWHWTQTSACTPQNLAIGAWMLSRVYAVAGYPDLASHHAEVSLRLCRDHDLATFCAAYAYEALARADAVAGRDPAQHLSEARHLAEHIADTQTRETLLSDLSTIG